MNELAYLALIMIILSVGFTVGFYTPRHKHKWKVINEVQIWDADAPKNVYPVGKKYILQCEECGQVKAKRT